MTSLINKIDRSKIFIISIYLISAMYILSSAYAFPSEIFKYIFILMRLVSYGLVAFKLLLDLLDGKYSMKELVVFSLIGVFLLIISYQSKTIGYLVYYIYIIVGRDVDYQKIIKAAFVSFSICTFLIVVLSKIGLIEDHVFFEGGRNRHGLGFTWTTYFPNLFMFIVLYYAFLRRESVRLVEILVIFLINIYGFIMTDTKSAFAMVNITIFTLLALKYIKPLRKYRKIYEVILILTPVVLAVFIILFSYYYDSNVVWMERFNRLLSGRLRLGKNGIETFGVSILAKHVVLEGGDNYNYIDSSFVRYIINFGIIFTTLIIGYLTYFAKLINEKKDIYMFLIFEVLLIHSTFDPELLSMSFDYFLFVLSYKNFKLNESLKSEH